MGTKTITWPCEYLSLCKVRGHVEITIDESKISDFKANPEAYFEDATIKIDDFSIEDYYCDPEVYEIN